MGAYSHALFDCLVNDLRETLPDVDDDRLFRGNLKEDLGPFAKDARQFAALALLDSILKKFVDAKKADADEKALAKFMLMNQRCSEFKSIDVSNISEVEEIALGEFRREFYSFWFTPDITSFVSPEDPGFIREISENGTFYAGVPKLILDNVGDDIVEGMVPGPGASIGASGTSFYQKMASSRFSCTDRSLFSLYRGETSRYSLWAETEKIRSAHYGEFYEVLGSKLSFVPKSVEISRTICTEPLLNMLFQKGVGRALEKALLRRYGINLSTQPDKNRRLAHIGSRDGSYGTIDLSSASDSVSIGLLRCVCPPGILSRLMTYRSPNVVLPGGQTVQLHMVSSMGNAFTFPLQTILFSSVVLGVYSALGIKPTFPSSRRLGNFAVFGDDIIVRREAYDVVCSILRRIGFEVNASKSYNEGPFRESCGCDFWSGTNVRGVYCRSLGTKHDLYSLINRLNVWSANHGICLPRTLSYLVECAGVKLNPVPPWDDDAAGIKVPLWLADLRWLARSTDTGSILYTRYEPRPNTISLLRLGSRPQHPVTKSPLQFVKTKRVVNRNRGVVMISNPPGVLLSAVGGYLREGKIHLRQDLPYYKKRVALAPCWDWYDACRTSFTSDGWQRWCNDVVYSNLWKWFESVPHLAEPAKAD